jgi:IS30 family transposase
MAKYEHVNKLQREMIKKLLNEGKNRTEIAREIGRAKSTISNEIRRNSDENGDYYPIYADESAKKTRKSAVVKKIETSPELAAEITDGLNKNWSPETIANTLKSAVKCCFLTIYNALYAKIFPNINIKKVLRRRGKKYIHDRSKFNTIQPEHAIHQRPKTINKRDRIGDFEGILYAEKLRALLRSWTEKAVFC